MEMGTPSKEAVVVPHHAEHILAKLCEMRSEGKMCDIEIQCQDQTFYAHRSVLASGSDFFANYLGRWVEAEQKVIEINSVESVPLATIINFLYTGVLDVNTNNMFNLFIAADKLQVEPVRNVCITKIHTKLSPSSCIQSLNLAQFYSLTPLIDAAIYTLCSESYVFSSSDTLSSEAWGSVQAWLTKNRLTVDPHTAILNIMQLNKDMVPQLRFLFKGMIEQKTVDAISCKVAPLASSIFAAAVAAFEAGEQRAVTESEPRAVTESEPRAVTESESRAVTDSEHITPLKCSEDVREPAVQSTAVDQSQRVVEQSSVTKASVEQSSVTQSSVTQSSSSPVASSRGVVTMSSKVCSSRPYTITCNHPSTDTTLEQQGKRRRIDEKAVVRWDSRIILLGGCHSTVSTVRTIFRHIQPFSVFTGVIVVNSNISLNLTAPDCDWEESGSLKKQAHGCASVTVGTKAYVFGGRDAESQYLNTMQEVDLLSSECRMLTSSKTQREHAVAVAIGDFIYIVGGCNTVAKVQHMVDRYNVRDDCWESVASCNMIGYLGGAAACNGLLYTFCGQRPIGTPTDTVMCYEPHSDSWSPLPHAPDTMAACQAATFKRKIFLLSADCKYHMLYEFRPDLNMWNRVIPVEPSHNFFIMNSALVAHAGYLYVLLFMCEDMVRIIRVQKFCIETGTWEIVSTKPVPVHNAGVAVVHHAIVDSQQG